MKLTDDNALVIYTDGSSLPHPRRGGYGIRFIFPTHLNKPKSTIDFSSISFKGATNNAMELSAAVKALEYFNEMEERRNIQRIIIYTDSKYVCTNYYNAKFIWPKTKWFLTSGAPVANAEIWKDLIRILKRIGKRVDIEWVKGHSKEDDNKAVDVLAKKSAKSRIKTQFKVVNVRRKTTPIKIKRGSINPSGQRLAIRIITSEYYHVQKTTKYQYEVVSKKSKYYQFNDVLFTKYNLKVLHTYLVSFKKDQKIATISKVLKEIIPGEKKEMA
jgi:ribonuclease HI